jgi:hypothetical protein
MIMRRLLLIGTATCALAGGLLLAGCGGDDPLPIAERVVTEGLGGRTTDNAPQVASTPEAFARLVEEENPAEEAASLRKAGFVTGAVTIYTAAPGEDEVFGLSGAIEYGSPEQASAELARLDAEFSSDPPEAATRGAFAGVPGSRTITATETEGGQAFASAAALFTDGPFLYAQFAVGPRGTVRPEGVLEAASALYERVKGRPAPTP